MKIKSHRQESLEKLSAKTFVEKNVEGKSVKHRVTTVVKDWKKKKH